VQTGASTMLSCRYFALRRVEWLRPPPGA
jgi:hypothetical protein